jgi:hypothetical protein
MKDPILNQYTFRMVLFLILYFAGVIRLVSVGFYQSLRVPIVRFQLSPTIICTSMSGLKWSSRRIGCKPDSLLVKKPGAAPRAYGEFKNAIMALAVEAVALAHDDPQRVVGKWWMCDGQ